MKSGPRSSTQLILTFPNTQLLCLCPNRSNPNHLATIRVFCIFAQYTTFVFVSKSIKSKSFGCHPDILHFRSVHNFCVCVQINQIQIISMARLAGVNSMTFCIVHNLCVCVQMCQIQIIWADFLCHNQPKKYVLSCHGTQFLCLCPNNK